VRLSEKQEASLSGAFIPKLQRPKRVKREALGVTLQRRELKNENAKCNILSELKIVRQSS